MAAKHDKRRAAVLIIDDEPAFLTAVSILLERKGHRVVASVSATEAIRRFREDQIKVAIVDMHLHDAAGTDVVQELKSDDAAPPIIMISSDDRPETVERCFAAGADRFMSKPVAPKKLLEAVAEVAGRN